MDEVGRGPLAGPVVTACVMLPLKDTELIEGVTDSKKLTPKRRAALEKIIYERAIDLSIGWVDEKEIDRINILQATRKAMVQAVETMAIYPELVLIDAVKDLPLRARQWSIIGGDLKSYSVGAASIVAKEYRDRWMKEMDERYPGYGFARNMGYGTPEHIAALKKMGPCPIHRLSFLTNILGESR
jgi:ribonuclease HII